MENKVITTVDAINAIIGNNAVQTDGISDGYHTFGELYEHRIELFIALARKVAEENTLIQHVWRTHTHSDGSSFDGWFLLGIGSRPGEQITYHLPIGRWNDCDFAAGLAKAPDFDGHTSKDVLERLKQLI